MKQSSTLRVTQGLYDRIQSVCNNFLNFPATPEMLRALREELKRSFSAFNYGLIDINLILEDNGDITIQFAGGKTLEVIDEEYERWREVLYRYEKQMMSYDLGTSREVSEEDFHRLLDKWKSHEVPTENPDRVYNWYDTKVIWYSRTRQGLGMIYYYKHMKHFRIYHDIFRKLG